ncbi:MAG TPA: hypothetical protein VM261_12910 [Kofleriaceae bacterium]|nr:hypothetical protein [Kofleriaceae bacterium]
MTIKNLLMLGGVLAGAAYLKDKTRRDRVFGKARDMLDQAKTRASGIAEKVESRTRDLSEQLGSQDTSSVGASRGNGTTSGYGVGGTGGLGGSGNYR